MAVTPEWLPLNEYFALPDVRTASLIQYASRNLQ
jgi:hypothetical protein